MANAQDATFVQQVAVSNLTEITEGTLALQKSPFADVDVFGAWMVADHSDANVMLFNAATQAGVAFTTTLDAPHQAEVNALSQLTGPQFVTAYLTDEVAGHQATLQALQTESQSGQDPQLVALATQMIPQVDAHLNTAQNLLALVSSGAQVAAQPSTTQGAAGLVPPAGTGSPAPAAFAAGGTAANAQDATFVQQVADSNLTEITEGLLALQKSPSAAVDVFGGWMVADHSNANVMLYKAATAAGVAFPTTLTPAHQAEANALSQLSGAAFNTAYLTDEVAGHQATLQVLQKEVQTGQNAQLVALASQLIPQVDAHLNSAQNLLALDRAGAQAAAQDLTPSQASAQILAPATHGLF